MRRQEQVHGGGALTMKNNQVLAIMSKMVMAAVKRIKLVPIRQNCSMQEANLISLGPVSAARTA